MSAHVSIVDLSALPSDERWREASRSEKLRLNLGVSTAVVYANGRVVAMRYN